MPHLGELLRRRRTDRRVGESARDERGKARLDRLVARAQRVVFGVRDGRRVLLIVALVVLGDLGGEPLELSLRLRFGQLLDGGFAGCRVARAMTLSPPP